MSQKKAEQFYSEVVDMLLKSGIPFMVSGTYALREYTGIVRPTKDLDLATTYEHIYHMLQYLSQKGFQTDFLDPQWIAKVHKDKHFVDIVFAERNGVQRVTSEWLQNARQGTVLGHTVKLVPPEYMIISKIFIQYRERNDAADVIHLILKQGRTLRWHLLMEKMDDYWEILLGHLLLFRFVYPSEKDSIPAWVIKSLLKRAQKEFNEESASEKITRGLLISSQYAVGAAKWGFKNIASPFIQPSKNYGR